MVYSVRVVKVVLRVVRVVRGVAGDGVRVFLPAGMFEKNISIFKERSQEIEM